MFFDHGITRPLRKAATALAILGSALLAAETADAARFNRSRAHVESICNQLPGGAAFNTRGSSGDYGCVADNGFIYCESSGSCEGSWTVRRTSGVRPQRALPPARVRN